MPKSMSLPLPDIFDVPLFPLPNVVLFPGMVLPLHIFETRYRLLLKEANDGDKLIAMGHMRPGWQSQINGIPPVYEIVGVGRIAALQALPDGTSNIALVGMVRCRIQEETQSAPYRIATVHKLQDHPSADQARTESVHGELVRITETLMRKALQPDVIKVLKVALKERKELGSLSDFLTSVFVQDPKARQEFLENTNTLGRASNLIGILAGMAEGLDPQPPPFTGKLDDLSLN